MALNRAGLAFTTAVVTICSLLIAVNGLVNSTIKRLGLQHTKRELKCKKRVATVTHLILAVTLASSAYGHSLQDVEAAIRDQERYAQFVDLPAPPFTLFDSNGDAVSKSDLAGKVVVLNFLYTRCGEACPLHMNLIAELQEQVEKIGLTGQIEFITIATDTEDVVTTRENMTAYGQNFALEPTNWQFLYRDEMGMPDLTRDLAEDYGLKFATAAENLQIHGVVTHVIDQEGRMRARFHGLNFQPEHLVSYLKVLLKGPSALNDSTWDEIHTYFEELFR